MSIKIFSFLALFISFISIFLFISFLFLNTSSSYYIELKKNEVKSYGQVLKNHLEDINFSLLNKDYIFNLAPYLPEYSYFIIFDDNYNIIFYFPYYFEVDDKFIKQTEFGKENIVIDNKEYLITYFLPINMNKKEYMLALEIDLSIIKDFRKSLINYSFYFLPLIMIFSFFISSIISNIIQNRLKIIRDFAVKVALGNLYYNQEYKYKDELEDVFKSIKVMKNNLIGLIKEVEQSKNTLQNILSSLPFTVFLIDNNKKLLVFNNSYNVPIDYFKEKINDEIIDYNEKKFKNIKISLQEGLLIIILDFTEVYEIERIKTKFLSEISHDLRTPIAATKSIILNIKDSEEKVNKAIEYLDKMTQMINKYLNYSKIKLRKIKINTTTIPINELIELINDSITFFPSNLIIEIPSNIPTKYVSIDIELFQQMFFNIIDNAVKNSNSVKIELLFFNNHLEIIVKNESKFEEFNLIKDIFYGLKDTKGLGLNIIKEISIINKTPIDISYENGNIAFKISLNYVSDPL